MWHANSKHAQQLHWMLKWINNISCFSLSEILPLSQSSSTLHFTFMHFANYSEETFQFPHYIFCFWLQLSKIPDHGLNYPMFMSSYCFMVWCLLYQSRKCCTFYAYVFLYLDRSTYTIRWSRKLWMCTLACSISMALLLQYRVQTLGVLPPSVRFIKRGSLVGVFPIAYGLSRVGLLTLEGLWDILPAVKLKEAKRARSTAYCVFDAGPGILLTAFLRKTPASGWTFMLVLAGLFSL